MKIRVTRILQNPFLDKMGFQSSERRTPVLHRTMPFAPHLLGRCSLGRGFGEGSGKALEKASQITPTLTLEKSLV